jgi:hypothetical protein
LKSLGFEVVTDTPYTQNQDPVIREQFAKQLSYTTKQRSGNNIRMLTGWVNCYNAMIQNHTKQYDFAIRIREDHGFTSALDIPDILEDLGPKMVMSTDCSHHGGINDRFAIVSSDAAFGYFVGPFLDYYRMNLTQQVPKYKEIKNTETLLAHSYLSSGLTVMESSKIRGLEKLHIDASGKSVVFQAEDAHACKHDQEKENNTRAKTGPSY